MKKIELQMTNKFFDYALNNIQKGINAQKVISELLKNEYIKKPYNKKINECCISELKYKGKKIKSCSLGIAAHLIYIEV